MQSTVNMNFCYRHVAPPACRFAVLLSMVKVLVLAADASPKATFADPIYTAYASKIIRPGHQFVVTVGVENTIRPINVVVEVLTQSSRDEQPAARPSSVAVFPTQFFQAAHKQPRFGRGNLPEARESANVTRVVFAQSLVLSAPPAGKTTRAKVTFNTPPTLQVGNYLLRIWGNDSATTIGEDKKKVFHFDRQTPLEYDAKSRSIFVQTDKPFYKPSDTIRFRVIAVDADLKPFKGVVDIFVHDADDNRISQWLGQSADPQVNGVFTKELKLSDDPILGKWKISVESGGTKTAKTVEIAKYVLPKFKINMKTPSFVVHTEKTLDFDVKAEYTYGKAVEGSLHIIAKRSDSLYDEELAQVERHYPQIKKSQFVSLPLAESIHPHKFFHQASIEILAIVTDKFTGIQRNATAQVNVFNTPFTIDILKTSGICFKPGLKYTFHVKLSQRDGRPPVSLVIGQSPLTVNITTGGDYVSFDVTDKSRAPTSSQVRSTLHSVPASGVIPVEVHPFIDMDTVWIEAHLVQQSSSAAAEVRAYTIADAAYSPSKTFMQLSALPKSNDTNLIQLQLNVTEPVQDEISYTVLSRGALVAYGAWPMSGQRTRVVTLQLLPEMAPRARIIASYVRSQNQEVVVDALDMPYVSGMFQNEVKIAVRSVNAKNNDSSGVFSTANVVVAPGDEVEFRVSSGKDSFVALAGIDESVLLLQEYDYGTDRRGDFNKAAVEAEIETYATVDNLPNVQQYHPWGRPITFKNNNDVVDFRRRRKRGFESSLPTMDAAAATDASEILDSSRMILLTNGVVHKRSRHFDDADPGDEDDEMLAEESVSNVRRTKKMLSKAKLGRGSISFTQTSVKVRTNFVDSWLWLDTTTGSNGEKIFRTKVPDTLTTWHISGFSMSDFDGLGIVDSPTSLRVFKPFFISLNLPHSILRGETFYLQVVVYNYKDERITAHVRLDVNDDDFDLLTPAADSTTENKKITNSRRKIVKIGARTGATVTFALKAKVLGNLPIRAAAESNDGRTTAMSDAEERKLLVEPEGERQFFNRPWLIDMSNLYGRSNAQPTKTKPKSDTVSSLVPEYNQSFIITYLDSASGMVEDSIRVEFSVVGDIMGPTLNNFDKLLRLPTGCGEQNMLSFAPNIYLFKYLAATGQLTPEIRQQIIDYARIGYQQQMKFKHSDFSFSAFGPEHDANGSVWLTAFVLRVFFEAKSIISNVIDQKSIKSSLRWLKSQQSSDGSFAETGTVFFKAMQGGTANSRVALTAYMIVTMLESGGVGFDDPVVVRALDCVQQRVTDVSDDPYALALVSYAMSLQHKTTNRTSLAALDRLAMVDADGRRYWRTATNGKVANEIVSRAHQYDTLIAAKDIETAAYALLAYARLYQQHNEQKFLYNGLGVLRWLISQRSELGGFISTQDTVVGLQAITQFATIVKSARSREEANSEELRNDDDVTVLVQAYDKNEVPLLANGFKIQVKTFYEKGQFGHTQIGGRPHKVELSAVGRGSALVQLSWSYNVAMPPHSELRHGNKFALNATIADTADSHLIEMRACTSHLDAGDSNMAIMQIDMPTSYEFDAEQLQQLPSQHASVQRAELVDQNTRAVLYFDKIGSEATCIKVRGYPLYSAENLQNRTISVFDYYEPSQLTSLSYRVRRTVDGALIRAELANSLLPVKEEEAKNCAHVIVIRRQCAAIFMWMVFLLRLPTNYVMATS